MGEGPLSQEEIDALLKQAAEQEGSAETEEATSEASATEEEGSVDIKDIEEVEGVLTQMEKDAIGEIGNISMGSAATALSLLLNRKVDITTPMVKVVKYEDLKRQYRIPSVIVKIDYTEGLKGTALLILNEKDAAIIADLMMGGDGKNPTEKLDELYLSAVGETMNQMMGSAATSMATMLKKSINISPPQVYYLDLTKTENEMPKITDEPVVVQVVFRMKIEDLVDTIFSQVLPVDFAKNMIDSLLGGGMEETGQPQETQTQTPPPSQTAAPTPQTAPQQAQVPPQQAPQAPPQQAQTPPPSAPQAQPAYQQPPSYGGASMPQGQPAYQQQQVQMGPPPDVRPAEFAPFPQSHTSQTGGNNIELLLDVPLEITVELGRTSMLVKDILELGTGSVIELDKLAGEPVEIMVNNKLIAKGEVVIIDENFGVRITKIISPEERVRAL